MNGDISIGVFSYILVDDQLKFTRTENGFLFVKLVHGEPSPRQAATLMIHLTLTTPQVTIWIQSWNHLKCFAVTRLHPNDRALNAKR